MPKPESNIKFNKGVPPSVGWWPTSVSKNAESLLLRWWDGEYWSAPVPDTKSSDEAAEKAAHRTPLKLEDIYWVERPDNWPPESLT
jgi:hypothetical protein